MDAGTIMVGDWVKFPTSDLCHKVYGLQGKSVKIDKKYWHKADKLEPVPLTAEILEKNGFELRPIAPEGEKKYVFLPDNSMLLEIGFLDRHDIWCDAHGYFKNFHGYIRYVHELQHVMRLCGIEKEITI